MNTNFDKPFYKVLMDKKGVLVQVGNVTDKFSEANAIAHNAFKENGKLYNVKVVKTSFVVEDVASYAPFEVKVAFDGNIKYFHTPEDFNDFCLKMILQQKSFKVL